MKEDLKDRESNVWLPKSFLFHLGKYLNANYKANNTAFGDDILRLEYKINRTGDNNEIAEGQNGLLYINEPIQDLTMKQSCETQIPLYDIAQRYSEKNLTNLFPVFDYNLGNIIDDSIVGDELIY